MTTTILSHSRNLLLPDHDPRPSENSVAKLPDDISGNPTPTYAGGATCCYNSLKLSPPFDSAMALTILVLLIALFFMGFFSIYIRRFADESRVDPTRRRRRRVELRSSEKRSGADPTTVESLPVQAYGAKQGIECAICLSEFEEREWVKEIPYCGHVFHVECIDTWLYTHVTCPLCRTEKLIPSGDVEVEEEKGLGVAEVRIVVDTWTEGVGPGGRRRNSTSFSTSQGRGRLHRSFSF